MGATNSNTVNVEANKEADERVAEAKRQAQTAADDAEKAKALAAEKQAQEEAAAAEKAAAEKAAAEAKAEQAAAQAKVAAEAKKAAEEAEKAKAQELEAKRGVTINRTAIQIAAGEKDQPVYLKKVIEANGGVGIDYVYVWDDLTKEELAIGNDKEVLFEAGINPRAFMPPIMVAVSKHYLENAKVLLKHGAAVDTRDPGTKHTSLLRAADNHDIEMVSMLLEAKADVNATNYNGRSSLMCACCGTKSEMSLVEKLLEAKADVKAVTKNGTTALDEAATWGRPALVSLLLAKNADLDSQDSYGNSPLSNAAYKSQLQVVKLLVQGGADWKLVNKKSETALQRAADPKHWAARTKQHQPTVDWLQAIVIKE